LKVDPRPEAIMRRPHTGSLLLLSALMLASRPAPAQRVWDSVAVILRTPAVAMVGYQRYNLPRTDLTVRLADVTVATPLIAGGWVGFAEDMGGVTMMGDLVCTPMELASVLGQLASDSIEVTAIHNHLLGEVPRLVYVHVHAHGSATDLATRVLRAISHTAIPLGGSARPAAGAPVTIDTAMVFRRLGRSGRAQGSVATVSTVLVPGAVRQDGMEMVPALGYGTPLAIQRVTARRYIASGDFAVLANRVQPVLRALAAAGITATALHTHLVGEDPVVYFIHFFADGTPDQVLGGLRAALDAAR
jgi:hypothetical protein